MHPMAQTDRQTHRHTDGHHNANTELAQCTAVGQFSENNKRIKLTLEQIVYRKSNDAKVKFIVIKLLLKKSLEFSILCIILNSYDILFFKLHIWETESFGVCG